MSARHFPKKPEVLALFSFAGFAPRASHHDSTPPQADTPNRCPSPCPPIATASSTKSLTRYPTKMAACIAGAPSLPSAGGLDFRRGHSVGCPSPRFTARARQRRRHVLHAVQPEAGRQAPGLGLSHAPLRASRLRRDLASLREEAGHPRRRNDRRRQGHAEAPRSVSRAAAPRR